MVRPSSGFRRTILCAQFGPLVNPAFALTVIGVLTFGVGLNAAVFTLLKSMALSPIAGVNGSSRLAVIHADTNAGRSVAVSYADDLAFMSNAIGPDYFRTLRTPLRSGREFADRDDEAGAPVAIVNDTLAQRFWGGAANAIGKWIRSGGGDWRTVVGVAADVKYARIDEAPRPYLYLPFL
jgi:hypothetical protein